MHTNERITLGRPRCGWQDNIKIHYKVTGWEEVDPIQDNDHWVHALANTVNLWVSQKMENFLTD
jgi:hypothetical protein